jgi:hypothetical protein
VTSVSTIGLSGSSAYRFTHALASKKRITDGLLALQ